MSTKWVLETQEDPETGDVYIEFPPDLLANLGWKEGDVLDWQENEDGSWSITKKE
jgi:hypothetical protein